MGDVNEWQEKENPGVRRILSGDGNIVVRNPADRAVALGDDTVELVGEKEAVGGVASLTFGGIAWHADGTGGGTAAG